MQKQYSSNNQLFGSLDYEVTDQNQVIVHIKLLQRNKLFQDKRKAMQIQKHLCLIIDDSGSMSGYRIGKVREHCAKFGEKFFEENGKKITLIKFGSQAQRSIFVRESDFQNRLNCLTGASGGTRFSEPLNLLSDTIVIEQIKELLVVFLTGGKN